MYRVIKYRWESNYCFHLPLRGTEIDPGIISRSFEICTMTKPGRDRHLWLGFLLWSVRAAPRTPPPCALMECPETHPILKYNETCFCEYHPCNIHSCEPFPNYPILSYEYDQDGMFLQFDDSGLFPTNNNYVAGKLDCYCTNFCPEPHCAGQRIPPECTRRHHHCPTAEHPIITYRRGECLCKAHPCAAAGRSAPRARHARRLRMGGKSAQRAASQIPSARVRERPPIAAARRAPPSAAHDRRRIRGTRISAGSADSGSLAPTGPAGTRAPIRYCPGPRVSDGGHAAPRRAGRRHFGDSEAGATPPA